MVKAACAGNLFFSFQLDRNDELMMNIPSFGAWCFGVRMKGMDQLNIWAWCQW